MQWSQASQPGRAPVAIIGLSCRFPGAADPHTFYHKLLAGVESIQFLSPAQLDQHGVDPTVSRAPNYVPAAAVLEEVQRASLDRLTIHRCSSCARGYHGYSLPTMRRGCCR